VSELAEFHGMVEPASWEITWRNVLS